MSNTYWLAGFVILLALGGAYLVWREQTPPSVPPPPVTLPTASTPPPTLTYYCTGDKTIRATFTNRPAEGGAGAVELILSDKRTFNLPQAVSGSGIRYEDTKTRYGTDVALIGKGDNAFLTENGHITYEDCIAAIVEESDAPGYATYTDVGKTFMFAFPTNVSVAGSAVGYSQDWSAQATASGLVLAKLVVPSSYQPGTNFNEAKFMVGVSTDPAAMASCLTGPQGAKAVATKVGDATAAKLTFSDAAAGNRYDTTSYRALHNGQCYAIEYTIHYGNIDNYQKGSVKEFDEASLTAALDEVAHSFQFLK